ncbi:MAG: DUF1684 domain-containing protein [Ignavibacteria bacterium]|jgi:uncharacterized protein (DUF1684 family)
MNLLNKLSLLLIMVLLTFSCAGNEPEQKGSPEYIAEITEWHQKRIERLKQDNNWLNLVGLFWLEEGDNSFGSAADNKIIFPEGSPERIGIISLIDSSLSFTAEAGVIVTSEDNPVTELTLKEDVSGEPTILTSGRFRWYIIKRGERYGIRLRDLEAPILKEFKGIERYPTNSDWKFEAKFEPYDPPKKIMIPNILGTTEESNSPGALIFNKDGNEYKLDALESRTGYFIIFADETSGDETYGAGRFLYTGMQDTSGIVILDFNKAYNPPCVFTKYATCPLPPKQNYLHLEITSGEKMWGEMH